MQAERGARSNPAPEIAKCDGLLCLEACACVCVCVGALTCQISKQEVIVGSHGVVVQGHRS
jgi:hypothetical protein